MTGRLDGKIAIVTGAGTSGAGWGNGKAVAVAMARAGARVVAVDLNAEAVEDTRDIIVGEGGECALFVGDMTESNAVRELVDFTGRVFGPVEILHNNVGIFALGGPVELSEDVWDQIIRVNLRSMFLTCKHALPVMVDNSTGSIINVGSISGMRYMGVPQTAYATTKAGIIAFSRSVAAQYGPNRIRANSLVLGIIQTPMLINAVERQHARKYWSQSFAETRRAREQSIPLRTYGDVWDVAEAAVFLASDEAKYITGTEIILDGGVTAMSPC